ncbi:OmpP1/FadL family transporter [Desulfovibrio cuneatus]|uniref:OmpP1/FadL family transporter n=1 Tax=Desulfovibrio cuneatus TaxID=159728 RepID=UPI00146FB909|nr:OmpP1/FadL family transporter [Desulfovibrio cuneatus]
MKNLFLRFAIFCSALAMASPAMAEGFALYEYSARSIALGGATMARKPDPSVLATNPATITRLEGLQFQTGLSVISPRGRMTGTDMSGQSFNVHLKDSIWPVPNFYYTHKLNDRVAIGVGQFSRFGLGFEYPNNWPGRFNVYEVELQTLSLNPNVAVAVTDELSVAAGVEVMYTNLNLRKRVAVNHPVFGKLAEVDSNIIDADSFGYGFNLATHYQFNDQWAAGLAYRSSVYLKNEGRVEYSLKENKAGAMGQKIFDDNFPNGGAMGRVHLPESVSGGVSYSPTKDLSVEVGGIWTRWSRFDALDIHLREQGRVAESPKNWKNTWRFNTGVEYQALDWLALRAGFVWDQSPMTEEYEDYLVPTDGRQIYSVGAGFTYDAWTFDVAYALINAKGRKYSEAYADRSLLESEAKSTYTDIVSFSMGYKF